MPHIHTQANSSLASHSSLAMPEQPHLGVSGQHAPCTIRMACKCKNQPLAHKTNCTLATHAIAMQTLQPCSPCDTHECTTHLSVDGKSILRFTPLVTTTFRFDFGFRFGCLFPLLAALAIPACTNSKSRAYTRDKHQ
jgi:hypothetical protein